MHSPSLKLLASFAVFYILLIVYGRMNFYRDPGSIFYDPDRALTRHYTDFRLSQAEKYIIDHDSESEVIKAGPDPKICAHFATVKREGVQYIENSVASALEGLTSEERQDIYLSVFFANVEPETHPSYHQQWLHDVVDEVYSHSIKDSKKIVHINLLEQAGNYSAKGVTDYVRGLRHCYEKKTPYVLMFEGDVVLADGWLVKTLQALNTIQKKLQKQNKDWLYLRLFNQERSTGWKSRRLGANNEHWISVAIVAAILLLLAGLRWRGYSSTICPDRPNLIVVCALIIPSLVILFFQSGKASLLPPTPGVFEQNFGCCSQALLYPREQIPRLMKYLRKRDHGQVDLMVNTHARLRHLSRMSLYPVQVQHVGVQSIRGTDEDEARQIWSMAFEDKNPSLLAQEHEHLVDVIYHGEDE